MNQADEVRADMIANMRACPRYFVNNITSPDITAPIIDPIQCPENSCSQDIQNFILLPELMNPSSTSVKFIV